MGGGGGGDWGKWEVVVVRVGGGGGSDEGDWEQVGDGGDGEGDWVRWVVVVVVRVTWAGGWVVVVVVRVAGSGRWVGGGSVWWQSSVSAGWPPSLCRVPDHWPQLSPAWLITQLPASPGTCWLALVPNSWPPLVLLAAPGIAGW